MDRAVTLPLPGGMQGDGASTHGNNAPEEDRTPRTILLIVENMVCGACMGTIERALRKVPGVEAARASLSTRRVSVTYDEDTTEPLQLIEALDHEGYRAAESVGSADEAANARADDLLRRLGVAGFAQANVMLLSVAVWAGIASDMDASAKGLFHWLSGLIAMPAIAYSGQPFFQSALAALKARRLNMDVPISLGIILATAMSVYQSYRGTEQVYFDAAITLTFFLLIGRYLDEYMRVRARGAAENLIGLKALAANVIGENGAVRRVQARELTPGMRVQVAAGERIPVDGRIVSGSTEIDTSLITGESIPRAASDGETVHAGTVNLGGVIIVEASATDDNTLLAEIARLVQAAEQGRGRYVRLADRAARQYAPAVHLLGALTLIGWMIAGAGFERSLTYAIAVLIITCPCALALAVPAVQVAAASRLFAKGVIVKAPDGLERLSEVDTIVFDKTGTLTRGEPSLSNADQIDDRTLAAAASLAVASRHPYSRAVVRTARERGLSFAAAEGTVEEPGSGLRCDASVGGEQRLGSAAWVGVEGSDGAQAPSSSLWFRDGSAPPVAFRFQDELRSDAAALVGDLRKAGFKVCLLSGDREAAVRTAAAACGIDDWSAEVRPAGKIERLKQLKAEGHQVLMVGDGLNDAPALAEAHASLSPSTAADVSQIASDAVFQGEALEPVAEALKVARSSQRMAIENFGISLAYNAVFVPLAVAGYVTPLLAAVAMSLSSIAVTANALRLRNRRLTLTSEATPMWTLQGSATQ
ncbi:heavy metal translocating P-type ATPase [Hyphomicrobium sp. D-2]|uniref:heavy metal translocating P-type ATPase n=1 Tax=Hyphomicrobium sp. D-2 TaxID=3041621 RepID=UPI0024562E0A|nr:heavy metal translocating P-type ATPase [Hyphomicrobium sp. D-2]MDH4981999.1 heavy metal translocating P-type ATPase [Hyphomicrobium sp. D-2]